MPDKQKSAQKSRAHKESKHTGKGARKFPDGGMTQLQKVLLVSGGMAHSRLRAGKVVLSGRNGSGEMPKRNKPKHQPGAIEL